MRWLRRLIVFVLGLILLWDTLANQFRPIEFAIALVMVGLIPIDTVVDLISRPARDEAEVARLAEVMKHHEPDPPANPEP